MPRSLEPPFYPLIYVRGYAGNEAAVEETVATPYMGFNLGSTKIRQDWRGRPYKYVFESPLVRLMKEYGYRDIYHDGMAIAPGEPIRPRSVIIYRYYDQASPSMTEEVHRPEIEAHADGLARLIEQVREQVCGDDDAARQRFRVYLVAHSMGGLICRCLLQNPEIGSPGIKAAVDKVFTYATPHNGIDLRVIGNVPGFFTRNNADNFNRHRMARYLCTKGDDDPVNSLEGKFPEERFFSLVGTNDRDYEVAAGWSRRVVGPMSDGLVQIRNAVVRGTPRAFVHRSHSGDYGIVNSEEGYQNLVRFLFGDIRVDGVLAVHSISLPPRLQRALDRGKRVRASYHFETRVRTRQARYDLHRRLVGEGSAIFRSFEELFPSATGAAPRHPHLFSQFLSLRYRSRDRGGMVFSVDVAVLVPEYQIDGVLVFDDHIEGSYLFRDTITLEARSPAGNGGGWGLRYGFDSRTPGRPTRRAQVDQREDGLFFVVPVRSRSRPGIDATLELRIRPWNR